MLQTAAKALVRNYFYQQFLPSHLSKQLIRSSNYLVLLGEGGEEEKMLGLLGIPDYRVYCVEHDPRVFSALSQRCRKGSFKGVLYFGELAEFISHYLHMNQRFGVLNLDVCGTYKSGIDPVMTEVLLFARRNPRTVVATYSNAGRDRPQLTEGLKSLVICNWLSPDATTAVVDELYGRYRAAGLSPTVSFNMVLRHLFWVRSNLEHALGGAVAVGVTQSAAARLLLGQTDDIWTRFVQSAPKKLTYRSIAKLIGRLPNYRGGKKLLDLGIKQLSITSYKATAGFYHVGWFALYGRIEALPAQEWLEMALSSLVAQPLRFADKAARTLLAIEAASESVVASLEVSTAKELKLATRKLTLPPPSRELQELEESTFLEPTPSPEDAEPIDMVPLIRQLAQQGFSTDEIVQQLPQPAKRSSVTAHVAVARREKSRFN